MDDISENLKDMAHIIDIAQGRAEVIMTSGSMLQDAHEEIERLREALNSIISIYSNPGQYPEFHRYQRSGLRYEWPALCRAIENAMTVTGHGKE